MLLPAAAMMGGGSGTKAAVSTPHSRAMASSPSAAGVGALGHCTAKVLLPTWSERPRMGIYWRGSVGGWEQETASAAFRNYFFCRKVF